MGNFSGWSRHGILKKARPTGRAGCWAGTSGTRARAFAGSGNTCPSGKSEKCTTPFMRWTFCSSPMPHRRECGAESAFEETQAPVRTNLNIISADGSVTEILEPGSFIGEEVISRFLVKYEEHLDRADIAVFSGSLPKGVPVDFYGRLISMAKKKNVKTILDCSGEALREGIKACPDLIKPNIKELSDLFGQNTDSMEAVEGLAEKIRQEGVKNVCVSLGEKGLLLDDSDGYHFAEAIKLEPVNTVGCGDAAVAALAYSFDRGDTGEIALKMAVAVSAANTQERESGKFSVQLMDEYLKIVKVNHTIHKEV